MAHNKQKQKQEKTGSGQYKCSYCGRAFNTEAELKEHNRMMHPQQEPQKTPAGQPEKES